MYSIKTKIFAASLAALTFFLPACKKKQTPPRAFQSLQTKLYPHETDFPSTEKIWDVSDENTKLDPTKKYIAFSFDDSPSSTLESIVAVFAAFNEENPDCPASATVFFNGYRLSEAPSTPSLVYTAGLELGNHTISHKNLTRLTESELISEIDEVDKLLYQTDKKPRHLLRAPFGAFNDELKQVAPTPLVNWTIDTLDWKGRTEDEIYNEVFLNKADGKIVLMHDGFPHTVSAIKRLLLDLKKAGYQVLSISGLSRANNCPLKAGKVYIQARKKENRG